MGPTMESLRSAASALSADDDGAVTLYMKTVPALEPAAKTSARPLRFWNWTSQIADSGYSSVWTRSLCRRVERAGQSFPFYPKDMTKILFPILDARVV